MLGNYMTKQAKEVERLTKNLEELSTTENNVGCFEKKEVGND